jgi:hypothetical protein
LLKKKKRRRRGEEETAAAASYGSAILPWGTWNRLRDGGMLWCAVVWPVVECEWWLIDGMDDGWSMLMVVAPKVCPG